LGGEWVENLEKLRTYFVQALLKTCCQNFSITGFQRQNFGENVGMIGCGKVNFRSKYLQICLVFVQHLYTQLKGFLVSFSVVNQLVFFELEARM
jgi:hypothetical protein